MQNNSQNNGASIPLLTWLVPAALGLWLFWLLTPILTPFLFAAILAYICNPLADKLEARKVPRSVCALLALLLLVGLFVSLMLVITPLVQRETELLVTRIPAYIDWLKLNAGPWVQTHFGVDASMDADELKSFVTDHLQNAEGLAAQILPSIKTGGLALIALAANLLLIPVVFFYVLRDWNSLLASIEHLIPRRVLEPTLMIARDIDQVLSEFLRGQMSVMLLMSLYYVTALYLAGLEFALPIGVITGLLVFIPYVGFGIGLVLAVLASLMQFQGLGGMLPVMVAFGIGQALEGMAVTPFLVGERIGLHPVAVIFALLAFGQLFGFFGVLLALPVSAALLVGLRHVRRKYLDSDFYLQ